MIIYNPKYIYIYNPITFRLLSFGASAHSVLSTNDVTVVQNINPLIFAKFLASFTTLMVEDVIRYELNGAPGKRIKSSVENIKKFEFGMY